jgi:hypothetical protein
MWLPTRFHFKGNLPVASSTEWIARGKRELKVLVGQASFQNLSQLNRKITYQNQVGEELATVHCWVTPGIGGALMPNVFIHVFEQPTEEAVGRSLGVNKENFIVIGWLASSRIQQCVMDADDYTFYDIGDTIRPPASVDPESNNEICKMTLPYTAWNHANSEDAQAYALLGGFGLWGKYRNYYISGYDNSSDLIWLVKYAEGSMTANYYRYEQDVFDYQWSEPNTMCWDAAPGDWYGVSSWVYIFNSDFEHREEKIRWYAHGDIAKSFADIISDGTAEEGHFSRMVTVRNDSELQINIDMHRKPDNYTKTLSFQHDSDLHKIVFDEDVDTGAMSESTNTCRDKHNSVMYAENIWYDGTYNYHPSYVPYVFNPYNCSMSIEAHPTLHSLFEKRKFMHFFNLAGWPSGTYRFCNAGCTEYEDLTITGYHTVAYGNDCDETMYDTLWLSQYCEAYKGGGDYDCTPHFKDYDTTTIKDVNYPDDYYKWEYVVASDGPDFYGRELLLSVEPFEDDRRSYKYPCDIITNTQVDDLELPDTDVEAWYYDDSNVDSTMECCTSNMLHFVQCEYIAGCTGSSYDTYESPILLNESDIGVEEIKRCQCYYDRDHSIPLGSRDMYGDIFQCVIGDNDLKFLRKIDNGSGFGDSLVILKNGADITSNVESAFYDKFGASFPSSSILYACVYGKASADQDAWAVSNKVAFDRINYHRALNALPYLEWDGSLSQACDKYIQDAFLLPTGSWGSPYVDGDGDNLTQRLARFYIPAPDAGQVWFRTTIPPPVSYFDTYYTNNTYGYRDLILDSTYDRIGYSCRYGYIDAWSQYRYVWCIVCTGGSL